MKKISYLIIGLLWVLFIPRVYAFSYDVNTVVSSISVKKGETSEIKVSLKNIQGTTDGIASCSLNISFDNNIVLNSKVSSLSNWSMSIGEIYLFDTGVPIISESDLLLIPVKIQGNGSVKLSNIACSDGNTIEKVSDKVVTFKVVSESSNNNGSGNNNTDNGDSNSDNENDLSSNCNLSNIELSQGTIEFDSNVLEYSIEIDDFESLEVMPVLENAGATYTIDKNISKDNMNVIITVNAEDGSSKTYTIYVKEKNTTTNDDESKESGNKWTIVFIIIIIILVLINIFRVVKNMKDSKKSV